MNNVISSVDYLIEKHENLKRHIKAGHMDELEEHVQIVIDFRVIHLNEKEKNVDYWHFVRSYLYKSYAYF